MRLSHHLWCCWLFPHIHQATHIHTYNSYLRLKSSAVSCVMCDKHWLKAFVPSSLMLFPGLTHINLTHHAWYHTKKHSPLKFSCLSSFNCGKHSDSAVAPFTPISFSVHTTHMTTLRITQIVRLPLKLSFVSSVSCGKHRLNAFVPSSLMLLSVWTYLHNHHHHQHHEANTHTHTHKHTQVHSLTI